MKLMVNKGTAYVQLNYRRVVEFKFSLTTDVNEIRWAWYGGYMSM